MPESTEGTREQHDADPQGDELRNDRTPLAIPAGIGLYIVIVGLVILGFMGVGMIIL